MDHIIEALYYQHDDKTLGFLREFPTLSRTDVTLLQVQWVVGLDDSRLGRRGEQVDPMGHDGMMWLGPPRLGFQRLFEH